MVRAPAPRPHPPLYDRPAARRDRAGRGEATSCASSPTGNASPRRPAWRAPTRSPPCSASSKGSRRRPAPGRPRSCRRGSANTTPPGSTTIASPGASPGPGCARATMRPELSERAGRPGTLDPDHPPRAPPCAAVGCAVADARPRPGEPACPGASPASSATTAPRSSTNWSRAPGSCARRSRRVSPNWWRWAS